MTHSSLLALRRPFGAILLLISILFSCGPSTPEKEKDPAASDSGSLWYLLTPEGGRFLPREALFARFPTSPELLLPWVNQLRVSDFFLREGRFFLGINGLGLGEIVIEGNPRLIIHRNSHAFAGRTLGGLFSLGEGILIQLYGDSVLNPAAQEVLPSLWRFDLQTGHFIAVPEGEEYWGRGWELVELHPQGETRLERWKKDDGQEVSFRYIQYPSPDSNGGSEKVLERETFRRLSFPVPLAEASRPIRSGWDLMGVLEDPERIRDLIFSRRRGNHRGDSPSRSLTRGCQGVFSASLGVRRGGAYDPLSPRSHPAHGSTFPKAPLPAEATSLLPVYGPRGRR